SSAISSAAGHRGATHTLLAVAVFTLAGVLVARLDWAVHAPVVGQVEIATTAVVTGLCAFAARALKLASSPLSPWLIGVGAGLLGACWLGALLRLLGDLLTTDGIPFPTWPLVLKPSERASSPLWQADGDVAVPILGNAGSAREWALCAVLSLYVAVAAVATILP